MDRFKALQKRVSEGDIFLTCRKIKKERIDNVENQQPEDAAKLLLTSDGQSSSVSTVEIEKSSSSTVTSEDARSVMVTQIKCEPCSEDDKYLPPIQHCSHLKDRLCKECVEYHSRLKSLQSQSIQKYCEIHANNLLDFYCLYHTKPCCKVCISFGHRQCHIIPLDQASKNVHKSALLFDTMEDLNRLTETVHQLLKNRNANLKSLGEMYSSIRQQIRDVKLRLLKEIDDLEKSLTTQLSFIQKTNEMEMKNQRNEILKLESCLTKNKQELDFLKEYGSDMHLYLALLQFVTDNKKLETAVKDLSSSFEDITIKFNEVTKLNLQMGSIQETSKPCNVQCAPRKSAYTQITQALTVFTENEDLTLKTGEKYWIADIAVTSENKLLMTNWQSSHPKVYIYKDCKEYESEIQCSGSPYGITVIQDTDTAIVTLPKEESIQFINTTSLTLGDKVHIGARCWGITTTRDKIIVGSYGVVHILDENGPKIKKVGEYNINSIIYDKVNNRLLCGYYGGMCCLTLDGKPVYNCQVPGRAGLTVDEEGWVYINHEQNVIHRLSSAGKFHDIVLNRDHGINNVYALSFNNDYSKLFVVNNNKSVSVFSCKKQEKSVFFSE